ncbi:MAG: hypothetical protein LBP92_03010, partial [Deltaproteobacteria bacterium]|nr:hypothetical protein [Deltaproteobacteria bacterium]
LALSFWGRLGLRLIGVKGRYQYGDLLPVVAGWGILIYLAHAVTPLVDTYRLFLTVFFLIGILGFILEIYIFNIKPILKKTDTRIIILNSLKNQHALAASLALGAALSFFYSAIWPSGRMEPWMNNGADFYSWLFVSDYLMSGLSREAFEVLPKFEMTSRDAFGTYMILDLISVSRGGQELLAAAPACAVTFLVWISMAAQTLLRRGFGLGAKTATLLALSLSLVPLMNYVAMVGMFGQLVAMVLLLVSLAELAPGPNLDNTKYGLAKRLFFPLFGLFLSYQAGFPLFAVMVASIGFLSAFLSSREAAFTARVLFSAKRSLWPALAATMVSFVLMPGVAYHLVHRLKEVYLQKVGWSLGFFSPWQFSGLPRYAPHAFTAVPESDGLVGSALAYLPLLALVIFLLIALIKISKLNRNNTCLQLYAEKKDLNCFIVSTSIAFLVGLALYLIAFLLFGHIYKTWKWGTYTALPLSFVPLALSVLVLRELQGLYKKLKKLPYVILLAIICILGFNFMAMPSLPAFPPSYFEVYSARPFLDQLRRVKDLAPSGTTIVVDMNEESRMFLPAFVFKETNKFKIKYIYGLYYFVSYQDFFPLVSKNSLFISDIEYKNIFRGEKLKNSPTSLFLYSHDRLNEIGYATAKSRASYFDWQSEANYLFAKIKIPDSMVGNELRFTVRLTPKEPLRTDCQNARLGWLTEGGETIWSVHDQSRISTLLPPEETQGGLLQTVVITGDGPGNPAAETCNYTVKGLYLAETKDSSR